MHSRLKQRGRRPGGTYSLFPHECSDSPNYIRLSFPAKALLHDLIYFYRGYNNGDIAATWVMMAKRGWKSRETLNRALRELEECGWIVCTRQGGRNKPTLFGLTHIELHDCGGKLDPGIKAGPALGFWKAGKNAWVRTRRVTAQSLRIHDNRVNLAPQPGQITCAIVSGDSTLPRSSC